MQLAIQIQGHAELEALLSKLDNFLSGTHLLDESAAILLNRTRTRFLQEKDPDDVHWIPSIAGLLRKGSRRGGGTLFDTGTLFHSIQLYKDSDDTRSIGSDVPYGLTHQLGLRNLPRRQFLGISDDDTKIMVLHIRSRIEAALHGYV